MTPAAKKTAAVLLTLFTLLFFKFRPYEHAHMVATTMKAQFFNIYFFLCNQSLGIVHEAGHGVCYILGCPMFITALNGTLFQLLFPLFIVFYARRKGHIFGSLSGILLLGFSLKYTAWYMSTAHLQRIVPASQSFLGVDGYHDFNYIFSALHVLPYDGIISGITGVIATLLMLYASARMLWLAFVTAPSAVDNAEPASWIRKRIVRRRSVPVKEEESGG